MAELFNDHIVSAAYIYAVSDIVRAINDKTGLEITGIRMVEAENVVRISINTKRMM